MTCHAKNCDGNHCNVENWKARKAYIHNSVEETLAKLQTLNPEKKKEKTSSAFKLSDRELESFLFQVVFQAQGACVK